MEEMTRDEAMEQVLLQDSQRMQQNNDNDALLRRARAHYLYRLPGFGRKTMRAWGSDSELWLYLERIDAQALRRLLGDKLFANLPHQISREDIVAEYEKLTDRGIVFLPYYDHDFPDSLQEIVDPPFGIYVKGDAKLLGRQAVAVVGARLCSEYGRYIAAKYGDMAAEYGLLLVSGMALGIDSIAQSSALSQGGKVCAVLGCGIDVCYPPENRNLYQKLWIQGVLVSEYPPGSKPCKGYFPERNRLISGLSCGVIVIEARPRSGTFITVDMALEQGKEVYAVPGRVTDPLSQGCNQLIRQGAMPALSPQEVLRELCSEDASYSEDSSYSINDENRANAESGESGGQLGLNDQGEEGRELRGRILESVDMDGVSADELYERVKPPSYRAFKSALMQLVLRNQIEEKFGNYFRILDKL